MLDDQTVSDHLQHLLAPVVVGQNGYHILGYLTESTIAGFGLVNRASYNDQPRR
jgi:hypothetical protein